MNTKVLLSRISALALILMLILCSLSLGSLAESFSATVKVSKMTVRSGPSSGDTVLGYLNKGTTVTVHSYSNGVAYIEYKGKYGYAKVSDMSRVDEPKTTAAPSLSGLGTVTSSSLKVYADKHTSSKLLGTLKKGATVTVLETDGTWAKLQNGSSVGYAKQNGLKINVGASATATPAPKQTAGCKEFTDKYSWATDKVSEDAVVTVNKMTVREAPNKNGKSLGTLKKNTKFTVHAIKDDYAFIEYKENFGFCLVSEIKITSSTSILSAGLATVTSSSIGVYSTMHTSNGAIGTLKKGETVTVVSVTNDWAKVKIGSNTAYVKTSGIRIAYGASATPAPTASPTPAPTKANEWWNAGNLNQSASVSVTRMNVYDEASSSAKQIGYLSKNTAFTVRAVNGSYAYIDYNGNRGFVKTSDYVLTAQSEDVKSGTATVVSDSVKVYESGSASSKLLGTYKKGQTFELVSTNGEWAKLKNGKYYGYAKISDLKLSSAAPTASPAPTAKPGAEIAETMSVRAFVNSPSKVYKTASKNDTSFTTLEAGTDVTVLGTSGSWALIERNSTRGYIDVASLTKVSDVILEKSTRISAEVKESSLPVYKYASVNSQYLGSVSKGTKLTILAYNKTWALVERNGNTGYCSYDALKITGEPVIEENTKIEAVISSSAAMYAAASTDSKKLYTISRNKAVTVLGYNDSWCLISYNGDKGYVAKKNVSLLSTEILTPNENYAATAKTKTTVYKYATTLSSSLGSVSKGTKVTLLAHNDKWALIELNGNRGYASIGNFTVQTDEFNSPTVKTVTATVIAKNAKVYERALETASTIGSLSIAENVTVTAYTAKWARINCDGKTGYVLISNLSTASYAELKSGNSTGDVLKLQKALEDLGYFDGLPASNYGSLTTAAVQRFQSELGVSVTGVADQTLLRVLYGGHAPASPIKSASLSMNSTGSNVLRLQNRLTYKGYLSATIDGEYGSITQKAVALYQKVAGLSETGTADAKTLSSLFSTGAPKNTGSPISGGGGNSGGGGGGSSGNYSTNPNDDPAVGTASDTIEEIITLAKKQLGKPYIYGTTGPNSYDCSGLTYYCFKKVAGKTLGRSAQSCGYNSGTKVEGISNLVRGDIVCFNTLSDNDLSDHVGIYLGNKKFIHASSGAGKVVISSLASGYYNRVFSWGRRIL